MFLELAKEIFVTADRVIQMIRDRVSVEIGIPQSTRLMVRSLMWLHVPSPGLNRPDDKPIRTIMLLATSSDASTLSCIRRRTSDPVFLHVKSGMTVIVTDTDGAWRMADVIWVDGGARNPKTPTLFQVADVDTGVINWVNADFVTHIVPRV